jgi:4-hydroxybenzoate polyprenyltransferase
MSKFTVILVISFLFFGLIYNVKPFRTKDIPFIDVYWESLNAPVRVVAGWHAVQADTFPSISLILGFYFAGVFLMTSKRASELKVLSSNNESSPAKYRRVFEVYTESRLIALLIFNVCLATTFFTIFVTEYNASLLITVPGVFLLFSMNISKVFKDASMVTKTPHYIYRDKATLAVLALFAGLFSLLHSLSAEILQSIIESQFAFLPVIFK